MQLPMKTLNLGNCFSDEGTIVSCLPVDLRDDAIAFTYVRNVLEVQLFGFAYNPHISALFSLHNFCLSSSSNMHTGSNVNFANAMNQSSRFSS